MAAYLSFAPEPARPTNLLRQPGPDYTQSAQTDAQQQCSGTAVRNTSIAADSQRITKPFPFPVYKLKVAVR